MRTRVVVALLLSGVSLHGQSASAPRPPDWSSLQAESVQNLRDYIRINTTNPPGNEILGARFLKSSAHHESSAHHGNAMMASNPQHASHMQHTPNTQGGMTGSMKTSVGNTRSPGQR